MSRLVIAFSLATALTSFATTASASAPAQRQMFAQAPGASGASDPGVQGARSPVMRPLLQVVVRAEVRTMLIANRAANLARFRAYQEAGVFPSNVYTKGSLNVWRDQDGHFCAAATIIRASGDEALVDMVAENDNFIRLADVASGPLMSWILTSGLTQEELVLIQRPFRPVAARPIEKPESTIAINAKLRAKETARLAKLYRQIEARLAKQTKRSLDAAVDRLMKRPQLAWKLVHGEPVTG
jgi:hypothetical protein